LDKTGRTWPALDVRHLPEFLDAALIDYHVTAISEGDDVWRIFFHTIDERDRAAAGLRAEFNDVSIESVDVADEDWAARSQASLRAVQIGRVIVAPPWDAPVTIVVQPSMGFGTGHHATTQLCLAALQQLDLRGKTVIDVGTGSGVLAMAASLLGAANVIGIDDDADAVSAARESLALNPKARVTLQVADLREMESANADLVLANLTGALLVAAADRLKQLTDSGGRLILSGFVAREEREVLHAFSPLAVEHRDQEGEWLCFTLR
jgi:ribosomal protein L11 methyltransferase